MEVRIFRKSRRNKSYHIEFTDDAGVRRRLSSGSRDHNIATWMGRNIERIVSAKHAAAPMPRDLTEWIDGPMPARVRDLLVKWNILDRCRVMESQPLAEHLAAWRDDLIASGRSRDFAVSKSYNRVKRIAVECGFVTYNDVTAEHVIERLALWRSKAKCHGGVSPATSDHYLGRAKAFCNWMVRSRRSLSNPLTWTRKLNDRRALVKKRRPLTLPEQVRLIQLSQSQPSRWNMTGPDRSLLYRLAIETGLRSASLRSLTKRSLHLSAKPPHLVAWDKGGKERVMPLRGPTVRLLKRHVSMMAPDTALFVMPNEGNVSRMLYDDLRAARIQSHGPDGLVTDFHALRTTFGTNLARSGVHPKLAQDLMGHSDINLTMQLYTHTLLDERSAATDALPDLDAANQRKPSPRRA